MTETTFYILGSVLIVSLVSFAGVFLLSFRRDLLNTVLSYLVSFAVGALFTNVFFHLLPEVAEETDDLRGAFTFVLLGIVLSFVVEKFIHWRHCHHLECENHVKPVGTLVLIGDAAHNTLDGILIAATYLVDIQLGIATTIAVILHEIPQEISDFVILLHSGFSRSRAVLLNFLSALPAFLGALAILVLHEHILGIEDFLVPLVAGNFIYIAGSDLIPELNRDATARQSSLQLLALVAGILLLMLVSPAA
jgi:zinc and cadmium transporter